MSADEYREFYKAIAKEPMGETLGWSHFKVRPPGRSTTICGYPLY